MADGLEQAAQDKEANTSTLSSRPSEASGETPAFANAKPPQASAEALSNPMSSRPEAGGRSGETPVFADASEPQPQSEGLQEKQAEPFTPRVT